MAAIALSVATPPVAAAQDRQSEARELFNQGLARARADRWEEALSAFRRSAALVPRPSTSYNIANALYRLDRPVEALSELDEYDRMPAVRQDEEAILRGARLRRLVEDTVGELRLTVTPSTAMLFIDGRPSVLDGSQRRVLLDPGSHAIRVTQPGYETHRREIRVKPGSRQAYSVYLELRPEAFTLGPPLNVGDSTLSYTTDTPSQASADDRKRFVKRPGFWVMIGFIAAAGIATGVAVAVTRKDDSPACGTTGQCATTQGLTVSSF